MTKAFIFPGQGSQHVGMGQELAAAFPAARQVFDEVDDALDQDLSQLMFEGPEDELTLTENAQPALMAVSMAVVRVLKEEGGYDVTKECSYVAGHSLGEYSALAAAGTFSLGDAARLLKVRGRAMQRAVPVGKGAMAALLGLNLDDARAIADEAAVDGEICETANDNAPGQVVLSGTHGAIERAFGIASDRGARRSVMLPVSAPFHCALMAPAADVMAEALSAVEMRPPAVPLIANVTAQPETDPATIRRLLVEQVTGMVRWRQSVEFLKSRGIASFFEVGAGKVLTGLVKRIERSLGGTAIGTPADIEAFLAARA